MKKSKFRLGSVVATTGINRKVDEDPDFKNFISESLRRYINRDWGDTCEEDREWNDAALRNGKRIIAVYIYPKTKQQIWIITEWNRSVTTVLFPEEY